MTHELFPLITVVIAVYNGAKTLQQCIDSVVNQIYLNREIIVIDGDSNDGSINILELNSNRIDYWISEVDTGIYSAWNKALLRAKGEWICFLGSDDYLLNDQVLTRMASKLRATAQDINVVYGQVVLLGAGDTELYLVGRPWDEVKARFKQVMCIPHPATMHRRILFSLHGPFDESFRIAADYEFLLRELILREAVFVPDLIVVAMRQGGISSNPANTLLSLTEVRRAQIKHSGSRAGWFWLTSVARSYLRLLVWKLVGEKVARRLLDAGRQLLGLPPYWTKI